LSVVIRTGKLGAAARVFFSSAAKDTVHVTAINIAAIRFICADLQNLPKALISPV
jgi:hypothetical protein